MRTSFLLLLLLATAASSALAQGNSPQEQAHLDGYVHFLTMSLAELKELISKAESGDAEAQYWIAIDCDSGLRLPDDYFGKSEEWLKKSAEGGYAPAQREYGLRMAHKDPPAGEHWLLAAAQQGDAEAEMWLGAATEDSWFGTTDLQSAMKWYRMAAEEGQVDAEMLLGNRYEMGHGVEQDYAKAAEWYRKAAEHVLPNSPGVSEARYHLGQLYVDGHGVPQDYVRAYFWFRLIGPKEYLDKIIPYMTPEEIAQAEELARRWRQEHHLPAEIMRAYHIVEKDEPY